MLGDHWLLRHAGTRLGDPNLWRLKRRPVSSATGIGLCVAFLPVPQLITIAILAVWLRINLPVALVMAFVTNPLTMAPAFYMNYLVGAWLPGTPAWLASEQLTLGALIDRLDTTWLPLYTGSLVVGVVNGLLGMVLVDYGWRIYVLSRRSKKLQLR